MIHKLDRRELLKLGLLSSFLHVMPKQAGTEEKSTIGNKPKNILIIVFDALSACNINFYGHQRQTMPNLTKLLERATVYHNHYAGGPFTTPGTASLLTGTYPWTHRGLRFFGKVAPEYENKNIFSIFPEYFRFAYTQNPLADVLLRQFSDSINYYSPLQSMYLRSDWVSQLFMNDFDTASLSERQIFSNDSDITYSIFLPGAFKSTNQEKRDKIQEEYSQLFPRGLPNHGTGGVDRFFTIEKPIEWLVESIPNMEEPFIGYIHLLPPHEPYNTRVDYVDYFLGDMIQPPKKTEHFFSKGTSYNELIEYYRLYDEFILYVDSEFGKLYKYLSELNVLDNTILILTSDHGEMFERGIKGHTSPALFVPVLRIPLVLFFPGQKERIDIKSLTSAVDVLPTLLYLNGQIIPRWCEGVVLPPYNKNDTDQSRHIFAVRSRRNQRGNPITQGAFMIIKEGMKLTHYFGYEHRKEIIEFNEMYDLQNDPEEVNNLFSENYDEANRMLGILMEAFYKAEEPYR